MPVLGGLPCYVPGTAALPVLPAAPPAVAADCCVRMPGALQIQSIEDADKKMAELASSGRIDPAFLQITAKAYGHCRDTNMTKDEAKWVAYKLYRQVCESARGAEGGQGGEGAAWCVLCLCCYLLCHALCAVLSWLCCAVLSSSLTESA